jgi:hypothetical protein
MITPLEAERFAREWLEAWNSHDLEAILAHYTEGVELTSPFVVQVLGDPSGTIKGKDHLRMYISMGLSMFPDLHFHLIQVFTGVSSLVLHYGSVDDILAAETMVFNAQGQVARVLAHYRTA